MKKLKPFVLEILFVIVLGVLSLGMLDVFWMPMGMQMAILSVVVVIFGAYAVYGLREKGGDEREIAILHMSDRVAFLAGAGVLLLAIVYESVVHHMSTPWVTTALFVMVAAKAIAHMYHNR